jgi:hypothetical protein
MSNIIQTIPNPNNYASFFTINSFNALICTMSTHSSGSLQEPIAPLFTPVIGDRGGFEAYSEIEASVREALPLAPRLLQILIAGSALATNENDRKVHKFNTQLMAETDDGDTMVVAEDLILRRFGGKKLEPYKTISNDYGFQGCTDVPVKMSDRAHYWSIVGSYVNILLANQPKFITEDVLTGVDTKQPDWVMQPTLAEPIRDVNAHPKPLYSAVEKDTLWMRSVSEHEEFWKYAEVSQWDDTVKALKNKEREGVVQVISGPRGIGKSNQLLPRLAREAQKEGRIPLIMTQFDINAIIGSAAKYPDAPISIFLDEPLASSFDGIAVLLKSLKNAQTTLIVGGNDFESEDARKQLAEQSVLGSLKKMKVRYNYDDLSEVPLLTEDTVTRWGQQLKVDADLIDLIKSQPYLRIPRVFDILFHGTLLIPDYRPEIDGTNYQSTLLNINHEIAPTYRHYLKNTYSAKRYSPLPRTIAEFEVTVRAETHDLNEYQLRYMQNNWLNAVAGLSGAHKDQSYDYYKKLCEALGLPVAPETYLSSPKSIF